MARKAKNGVATTGYFVFLLTLSINIRYKTDIS